MNRQLRVLLIGGSSHAGKSTLARALGDKLGWSVISTDTLARHPGRPWPVGSRAVPEHVAEHYLSLDGDELIRSVLEHYHNMWPRLRELIEEHAGEASTQRIVIEGSALWPANIATLACGGVAAIWLTASDRVFEGRILAESGFVAADARG